MRGDRMLGLNPPRRGDMTPWTPLWASLKGSKALAGTSLEIMKNMTPEKLMLKKNAEQEMERGVVRVG
jgi:hypothetical protein